ncbi:hypothetical protein D3C79_1028900 [compost metagenome]
MTGVEVSVRQQAVFFCFGQADCCTQVGSQVRGFRGVDCFQLLCDFAHVIDLPVHEVCQAVGLIRVA